MFMEVLIKGPIGVIVDIAKSFISLNTMKMPVQTHKCEAYTTLSAVDVAGRSY